MDLIRTIADSVRTVNDQAKLNDVLIEYLECDDVPEISGDRGQIIQVFSNLLNNSIFAISEWSDRPSIGRIEIGVNLTGGPSLDKASSIEVTVWDNGPGIDLQNPDSLFEPFNTSRANGGDRSGDDPGAGLGLAVVKTIIVRHGGTISLVSEPGKGATFTIVLPIKSPATLA